MQRKSDGGYFFAEKCRNLTSATAVLIQMAVDPDFRHGDVDFEPVEHREIKHKIERHEPDGMAGKPVSHGTHFLCLELEGRAFLKFLAAYHYTPVIAQKQALNRTTSLKYL